MSKQELAPFVAATLRDEVVSELIREIAELSDENEALRKENAVYKNIARRFEDRTRWRLLEFIKTTPDGPVVIHKNYIDKLELEDSQEFWFDVDGTTELTDFLNSELVIDGMSLGVIKNFSRRDVLGVTINPGTPNERYVSDRLGFGSDDDDDIYLEVTIKEPLPESITVEEFENDDQFDFGRLLGLFVTHIRGLVFILFDD